MRISVTRPTNSTGKERDENGKTSKKEYTIHSKSLTSVPIVQSLHFNHLSSNKNIRQSKWYVLQGVAIVDFLL